MFTVRWHCCKHSAYTKYTNSFKPHNTPIEVATSIPPILLIKQLSGGQITNLLKITQLGSGEAGIQTKWSGSTVRLWVCMPYCLSSNNNKKASAPESA